MVKPSVVQQMDSEVDIRSLFLCFDDSLIGFPCYGPSKRSFYFMAEKMSIMNLDLGSVRQKSPKVGFLPEGLVRVLRRRRVKYFIRTISWEGLRTFAKIALRSSHL